MATVKIVPVSLINSANPLRSPIPNEPKYQSLLQFIEEHRGTIDRDNFGEQAPRSYFKQATTNHEIIISELNSVMSKITNHNHQQIMEQFTRINFGLVEEPLLIANTIHQGIITCPQHNRLFVKFLQSMVEQNPRLVPPIRDLLVGYDQQVLPQMEETDGEFKLILKNNLKSNFEMMVLLHKNLPDTIGIDDLAVIINRLVTNSTATSLEMSIRFVQSSQKLGLTVPPEWIDRIGQHVKDLTNCPRMLTFLMMEINTEE